MRSVLRGLQTHRCLKMAQDSSKIHVTWEWTGEWADGFLLGVMKRF